MTLSSGQRMARNVIAQKLRELLPDLGVDHGVLADQIAEAITEGSVRRIDDREAAVSECITQLMQMYHTFLSEQGDRIEMLEAERTELTLRLAKVATADVLLSTKAKEQG